MAEQMPAAESGRTMRIMLSSEMSMRVQRGERFVRVTDLPWEMFCDVCERAAQREHSQSLTRLSERGGVDATEAICILTNMTWQQGRTVTEEQAHRILYAMRSLYRRGVLAGLKASEATNA